ncbi:DegT/DnrJ/EryC1/StrS family aminotransferase (plasmid) [Phyllobacterium sp. A18/5-2]|uniref:DegT/DnrJ/EryC1/StrS family aminotransferase n=1 Tax=Phyllobacterium sp. A18/5-2 TaxID=2978392 RepID=UPI0021C5F7DE|nr:DegT/DnrJ/EryC1/StrS family aminotransferase [Phyllobacterium sp. A18/5-2]UXN66761.1 DegT/DnrJ/EryC1/StrS family aminotransferase [Phyllobacterium sp. A18/5-2]
MHTEEFIPFNDLGRLYSRFQSELETALLGASRSGWWLNGNFGKTFAENFANFLGVSHCLNVANGTDALELSLRALSQIRGSDANEVITVANAGGYTTTACRQVGLTPVYVDINPDSHLIELDAVIAELNDRSLAVVATHLYGGAVDVIALKAKLQEAGFGHVYILEDCAQSHGATINRTMTGSMGDVATFSFYPTKNLGAMGDGGAVVTSDPEIATLVKRLQQYGWHSKYAIGTPGGRNSRMDELQAATLSVLLSKLPSLNAERIRIKKRYSDVSTNGITFVNGGEGSVAHLVVVVSDNRDGLKKFLTAKGISTEIHYPILDSSQVGWSELPSRKPRHGLPFSETAARNILSLPCFPGLTDEEINRVCSALAEWRGS